MVDTLDSGSSAGNGVEVRLLSRAPSYYMAPSSHKTVPDNTLSWGRFAYYGLAYAKSWVRLLFWAMKIDALQALV